MNPDPNREMPPPSAREIAEWADGVVYAKAPNGDEVYFDTESRAWRKVRRTGPGSNAQWPLDKG